VKFKQIQEEQGLGIGAHMVVLDIIKELDIPAELILSEQPVQ
jgi:hypothetical protein